MGTGLPNRECWTTNCWGGGGELGCGTQRRSTCQLWAVSFLMPWLGPAPLFLMHGPPRLVRLLT